MASAKNEKSWNFVSLLLYFAIVLVVGYISEKQHIYFTDISIRELVIMTLATYRLTRIIVFEKILKFFRDFIKRNEHIGIIRTIRSIITCPWCAGVWISVIIYSFFFFIPFGMYLVYFLAISGVASFIIMIVNYTGLKVEEKHKNHQQHKKD